MRTPQGDMNPYHGIDRCDRCGRPLEKSGWLSGLCKACKQETSNQTPQVPSCPTSWVGYPKIGLNTTLGLLRREKHVGRATALPHAEKSGYPFHPRDGERITGCNLPGGNDPFLEPHRAGAVMRRTLIAERKENIYGPPFLKTLRAPRMAPTPVGCFCSTVLPILIMIPESLRY